jgi:hypothetical protein
MASHLQPPTAIRPMNALEYHIVSSVFGTTLPDRHRILITNAAGVDGRAFTIPTSLLSSGAIMLAPFGLLTNALVASVNGMTSLGFLMNVGTDYNALAAGQQRLLVHETTHVWQGHNSPFSLHYVFSSMLNQAIYGGGAYAYAPGQPWRAYNAEQQAAIVEDWFRTGQPVSGPLYPYIVDHVRKGDA